MKWIFLLTIFFIPIVNIAQPNYLVDSIVVKISNDTVYVWDYNAWEHCLFQLDYTVVIVDSIITITQIDTALAETTCYWYHNFVIPIIGLSEGKYRIDIYRDCLSEETRFIKSFGFEYIINSANNEYELQNQFTLYNAFPNPFNPTTKISYLIPYNGYVSLKIYNSLCQEVAILISEIQERGLHEINFRAEGLASGFYYYRLQFENKIQTKKIMLLK